MKKSVLVSLIAGYLEYHRGFDQSYHKQFVWSESKRIAAEIRNHFGSGNLDESNKYTCASIIRVIMAKPEYLNIRAGRLADRRRSRALP